MRLLMQEESVKIHEKVSTCFIYLDEFAFFDVREFIVDYIHSPSFKVYTFHLMDYLKKVVMLDFELVLDAIESFTETILTGQHDAWRDGDALY